MTLKNLTRAALALTGALAGAVIPAGTTLADAPAPAPAAASAAAPAAAPVDATQGGEHPPTGFDVGTIIGPHVYRPKDQPDGVAIVVSDLAGWTAAYDAEAEALVKQNIAVIGLNLPDYLAGLETHPYDDDCTYAISDLEELSKRLQAGAAEYHAPILAGVGEGAGLVYSLAAQMPAATVATIVAVDPTRGTLLREPLCTDAKSTVEGDRTVYDFVKGDMNVDVDAIFTPAAAPEGQTYVTAMAQTYPRVKTTTVATSQTQALADALDAHIAAFEKPEGPLNLPLAELPVAQPTQDTLAVIYSGDGGWRDIDRSIGEDLQSQGIPVVGLDSLRYFWNERTPQETADDLAKIIQHYAKAWKVGHVLLIGYSFGADIMPNSYDLLPDAVKARVTQMTLLGLSHERDYVIHVDGWLGMSSGSKNDPTADLARAPAKIVQCIYGQGDDDDACHGLTGKGYELVELQGGHHFDGDYGDLTKKIVAGLKTRLQ